MPIEITPTLVIGIGGTGKKVIMEVKRQLYESYGLIAKTAAHEECLGYPVIDFLCIDADATDNTKVFANTYDDSLTEASENVKLKSTEFVAATIDAHKFTEYQQNLENNPLIANWMPKEVMMDNSPAIVANGAGQHRLFGRLCFFEGFHSIKEAINSKLEKINSAISGKQSWIDLLTPHVSLPTTVRNKIPFHEVHVYIVNSLAGGTGCGMFLDVSMLTKTLLNKWPNLDFRVQNISLMPSGYMSVLDDEKKERVLANAYAALKEVEFLSLNSNANNTKHILAYPGNNNDEEIQWTNDASDKYKITGSASVTPWDIFYLIDTVNKNNVKVSNSSCIKMIADRIFCNFDNSELPSRIRSIVPNNQNNLNVTYTNEIKVGQRVIVKRTTSQRFGTFGLSSYKYDRENLKRRAAHVLGERFLFYWLNKTAVTTLSSPDLFKIASKIIGERPSDEFDDEIFKKDETFFSPGSLCTLLLATKQNKITQYLEGSTTEPPRSFSYLKEFDNDLSSLQELNASSDPYKELLVVTSKHEKKLVQLSILESSSSVINIPIVIKTNLVHITSMIPDIVKKFLIKLVSEHGVNLSLVILKNIESIITEWKVLNRKLRNNENSLKDFDGRIKDAKKILLPWFKKVATEWEIKRISNDIYYRFESAYYDAASDSIDIIYTKLLEAISGTEISNKVTALSSTKKFEEFLNPKAKIAGSLGDLLESNQKSLLGANNAPLAYGAMDHRVVYGMDTGVWDKNKFQAQIAELVGADTFDEINVDVFKNIEAKVFNNYLALTKSQSDQLTLGDLQNTLFPFNSLVSENKGTVFHSSNVYTALISACMETIPRFAQDISISRILIEDRAYKSRIADLALYSIPYLTKANQVNQFINMPNSAWKPTTRIIAYKTEIARLAGDLSQVPNGGLAGAGTCGMADDSIVIYQDLLVFPLASVGIIRELGDAYERQRHNNNEFHLSYEFREYSPDIRPLVPSEHPKYIARLKNVINGIILGSIELSTRSSCYILNDPDCGDNFKFTLVLDRFVDRLLESERLHNLLEKKNNDCFSTKMSDDHFFGYWIALVKLWLDLRLLSDGNLRHPVMELIDAVMLPDIINHKPKIIENLFYSDVSKVMKDIKALANPQDETPNKINLENKFNDLCSPFLRKPTEEALKLKDYFVIHTLKF